MTRGSNTIACAGSAAFTRRGDFLGMKAHRMQSKGKVSFLGVSCKTEITLPRRMTEMRAMRCAVAMSR